MKHEMAGILRRLAERDIVLVTSDYFTAETVYQHFRNFASCDVKLSNALFFERKYLSMKFRSAPGVIHELTVITSDSAARRCFTDRADIVIHSCRPGDQHVMEQVKAMRLNEYIKEG